LEEAETIGIIKISRIFCIF